MTKRHPLTLCSWNVGNGVLKDAQRIIETERPAALGLQEASDQHDLVRAICDEFGYIANDGDGLPGQAATPLLHDPGQVRAIRPIAELMAPGQSLNDHGRSPNHLKPKWLIGGRFIHLASRRRVAICSTHRVAGQTRHGDTIRDRVAREHAAEVRQAFEGYRGVPIVAGDWNSLPDDGSLQPFWKHGWASDQMVLAQRIPTHGGWTPDHLWWRREINGAMADEIDDRIRYVGHHTIDGTKSDHRPLVVDFELTARPR